MSTFRSIRKRLVASTLLAIVSVGGMLATPATAATDGNTVKVATSTPFPPFTYKEDGKFVGFENELFHAVAKAGNFPMEVLESAQFAPELRAERLTVEDWLRVYAALCPYLPPVKAPVA